MRLKRKDIRMLGVIHDSPLMGLSCDSIPSVRPQQRARMAGRKLLRTRSIQEVHALSIWLSRLLKYLAAA